MQLIEKIIASYRFAPDSVPGRRYDLDWLRVLAFGLLIFYHIGMVYVARWGFHVKSPYASTHLESLMLLVNPWRMAILWFISGVAIRFVLAKVNKTRFLALRTVRLLLPLLFAVLVIIPPQLYCEMTQKGDLHHSYVEFLKAFFTWNHPLFAKYQAGILPHMDVNHLWYLRELWTFSLLLLLAMPIWNSRWFKSMMAWLATHVSVLVLGLVLINTGLEWVYREPRNQMGFLFLCFGFAIAWQEPF
ncbi:MAG: acyltransferase family protein [Acidobacteria bacterium]|nr:acyltransferase family protein [Acidobacteriota bacterium]